MTYGPPQGGYGAPKPPRQNSGFIVPNDRKNKTNDPDMKGTFTIGEDVAQYIMQGGRDLWVSAWHKQAKNPKTGQMGPLTSLGMQPKLPKAQAHGGYGGPAPQPQHPQYGGVQQYGGPLQQPAPTPQYQQPQPQQGTWGQPAHTRGPGPAQHGAVPQQGYGGPARNPVDDEIPF